MSDNAERGASEQQAKHPQDVAVAEHQAEPEHSPDRHDNKASEQRWQKRFAIYSLVFDGIVAVSAIFGGIFIWQQLVLLRESNELTRKSNKLTSDAFVESKRQAVSDEKQRDADRREAARLAEIERAENIRQFEASLAQSKADSAASLQLAHETLTESRRALVESQRARLGLFGIDAVSLGDGTTPLNFTARIHNNGNAPATEVRARWGTRYVNGPDRPDPLEPFQPAGSIGVIMGHASYVIRYLVQPLGPPRVERLRSGAAFFYAMGAITYLDGFGNGRHLEFCHVLNANTGAWEVCSFGSSAD